VARRGGRQRRRLAFVATDEPEKSEAQVFVLPMAGGEARKITEAPMASTIAWRPSGQDITM